MKNVSRIRPKFKKKGTMIVSVEMQRIGLNFLKRVPWLLV